MVFSISLVFVWRQLESAFFGATASAVALFDFLEENMNYEYLNIAFEEAEKAFKKNEIPVGAVIVKDNTIISKIA